MITTPNKQITPSSSTAGLADEWFGPINAVQTKQCEMALRKNHTDQNPGPGQWFLPVKISKNLGSKHA